MRKGMKTTAIFGALIMVPVLAACGGSADADSTRVDTPKTLVGEWYQSNKLDNGMIFHASVYRGGSIQVDMQQRDSSSHYWMGSFPSYKSPRYDFKTVSKADPDAQKWMKNSLFGSQDSSKKFQYDDGELSFKFTMMGTTSTVRLRKHYEVSTTTRKPTPTYTASNPGVKNPPKVTTPKQPSAPKAPAIKAPVYKAPSFKKRYP